MGGRQAGNAAANDGDPSRGVVQASHLIGGCFKTVILPYRVAGAR